ncbi:MAG: hypothetical protein HOP15_15625 [Planctomycetes bacterium]|nr:hypothetical protein [Planctomycetota bacterium]
MAKPVQNPSAALELAETYDIKGGLRLQLDEVIVPVQIVGPKLGPAAYALTVTAAVVGEQALSHILCPPVLGALVNVYRIIIRTAVATSGVIRVPTAAVSGLTGVTEQWQDRKRGGVPGAIVGQDTSAAPAAGVDVVGWATAIGIPFVLDLDVVLIPATGTPNGDGNLMCLCSAANVAMDVTWLWREPPLDI